ncbi:MAG: PQQ-dependent sugar dehydrogenase [Vicinamibacterales bacterium]
MIRRLCALGMAALGLVASPALALPAKFSVTTAVSGLASPMAFVFTTDGRMLVAERAGRVRVVRAGTLLAEPALTLAVLTNGERGLMSLAVDPSFGSNGWFYLYYTTTDATPKNRVSRFTMVGDVASPASEVVLFEDAASTGGYHNGGWIDIGPDGRLYVSTGDGQVPTNASDLGNLKGKILRFDRTGAVPATNPFVGRAGARPEIFVYGLRNPFRATFSPDGRLFIGDVGQDAFEEIDIAGPAGGENFGWPTTEGATSAAGITPPAYTYAHEATASITAGAFATTGVYPAAYHNALFFADFMRDTVSVLHETTPGGGVTVEAFDTGRDAIVAMRRGLDGYIYFASLWAGTISRIDCEREPTNPTIALAVQPADAAPGSTVTVAATVAPGAYPASTGMHVDVDASPLGGAAAQALHDDGMDGDVTAGDGTWSHAVVVGAVPAGAATIVARVVDGELRSATASAVVTVQAIAPPPPSPELAALASRCASMFGLQSSSSLLFGGATADADGDGVPNQAECAEGVHPRGYFTQFFAEGATGALFDVTLSLTNPRSSFGDLCPSCGSPAHVQLSFLRADGTVVREQLIIPEGWQQTVDVGTIPGLESAEFSITIESDEELIAERTMSWDRHRRGAHAEHGVAAASSEWYFAEGATQGGFSLFYLLANPGDQTANVTVTYLLPGGRVPVVRTYPVMARSRRTIWVNHEDAQLAATDVSAHLVADRPIIAERAMYLNAADGGWSAGHDAAGVTTTSTTWLFAEGATGAFFDTYLLLANPSTTPADVTVTYLRPDGLPPIRKSYRVGAQERLTVDVEHQDPDLADTAVSMTVTSSNGVGVIAERAMWWPGPTPATWAEAHVSPGSPTATTEWGVGGGEVGGPDASETYILIANTSARAGTARVTLMLDDGTTSSLDVPLPAKARTSVPVGSWFPAAQGKHFGARVQSTGVDPVDLIVERSSYWSAGRFWTAGTNALGSTSVAADVVVRITATGLDRSLLSLPRGARVRFVNEDIAPHFITSDACGPIESIGVLGPGESAVSGAFLLPQSCSIYDRLNVGAALLTGTVLVP